MYVYTHVIYSVLQGDHTGCHTTSSCHIPHYTPSKAQLTDPRTIQKLSETYIYRCAQEFCVCGNCTMNKAVFPPFSVETFFRWIFQPYDAYLRPQTHSLFYSHIQDENELGSSGLGKASWLQMSPTQLYACACSATRSVNMPYYMYPGNCLVLLCVM